MANTQLRLFVYIIQHRAESFPMPVIIFIVAHILIKDPAKSPASLVIFDARRMTRCFPPSHQNDKSFIESICVKISHTKAAPQALSHWPPGDSPPAAPGKSLPASLHSLPSFSNPTLFVLVTMTGKATVNTYQQQQQ